MAFATVALAELALVFSLRSPVHAAWDAPRNVYLVGSVVLSAAIVIAALYLPGLNEPLGTVPLGLAELAVVVALALVPFACVELGKAVLRQRAAQKTSRAATAK
jgi:Ca2+-transporting ATPase